MKLFFLTLIMTLFAASDIYAQGPNTSVIAQSSPEMCGMAPGSVIPIPAAMTVAVERSLDQATVSLSIAGSRKSVQLPGVVSYIEQVCPLPDQRAVVFGNSYQATNISVIDLQTGDLLDHFDDVQPMMSPDQRWIAFQEFYPEHMDRPVSNRYRIYDLKKDAVKNRAPGINTDYSVDVGALVFPLVAENGDSQQRHDARTGSFAWAPDSKTVGFLDESEKISIVLATVDSDLPKTYISPITLRNVCVSDGPEPRKEFVWDAIKLDVSNAPERSVTAVANGVKDCSSKPAPLYFSDFRPAEMESARPRKKSILVTNSVGP